jgi:hypothetical protein
MPLSSRTQIVGGGANLLAPVTIGTLPVVVDVGPPGALSDSIARQRLDGAVNYIVIGAANVREGVGATETFRLSEGFITEGLGVDSIVVGRNADATQTGVIAIGLNAEASGTQTTAVGEGTRSTSQGNVALGYDAEATAGVCIAIGSASRATGANSIAMGSGATAQSGGGTGMALAIGYLAVAGNGGVANYYSIAIGNSANAARRGIAIGFGASAEGPTTPGSNNLAIGHGAQARNNNGQNIVIGGNSTLGSGATSATNCVVIGTLNGLNGAAINRVVVLGSQYGSVPNLANIAWLGTPGTDLRTFVFGAGDDFASTPARTMRFTNASGLNNAAGNVTWLAPRSTGNAVGAGHIFSIGTSGPSSSSLQAVAVVMRLLDATLDIRPTTRGRLMNITDTTPVFEWGADVAGFFGVTPAARQLVPIGSSTDDVINALNTLGLFRLI